MRSIASIISSALLMVLAILTNCIAQNKKDSSHFPTYEEIKGNRSETIDYVAPRKLSNDDQPVITKTLTVDKYWNAFNYPADSTVYYLNGKQVKSLKAAKKELEDCLGWEVDWSDKCKEDESEENSVDSSEEETED